jgi:inner membrane protein
MEPITHLMTGACLARAGCNRKAAYATLAMTLAAEMPDLDTLWSIDGPVAGFQHHRGITHTFIGIPFEAAAVVGAIWLLHRWRVRRVASPPSRQALDSATDQPILRPLTRAPIRWSLLYGFALLALLSHILLDWTNNYGVRPFFPFNPRWYAGSFVFILEPVLFAALLIGLVAPSLFGLIGGEIGAHKARFRGRGWAIFALVCMVCLWSWRALERSVALNLTAMANFGPADQSAPPPLLRVFLSPYPINPFRWHAVVETPDFYQLATVDALRGTVDTAPARDILYKPPVTLDTSIAKQSSLGQVYLDWSSWPLVTDIGPVVVLGRSSLTSDLTPKETRAVTFRDLRFMYDVSIFRGRRDPPVSGTVYLSADHRVARMEMGGKQQK